MGKKFDMVTHVRNDKGIVTRNNPYRFIVKGDKQYYERPPGSGNLYYPDGTLFEGPVKEKAAVAMQVAKKEAASIKEMVAGVAAETKKEVK